MLQLKIKKLLKNYFQRILNKKYNSYRVWHSTCYNRVIIENLKNFNTFPSRAFSEKIKI